MKRFLGAESCDLNVDLVRLNWELIKRRVTILSGNRTVFRGSFQHLRVMFSGCGKAAGLVDELKCPERIEFCRSESNRPDSVELSE